jgi:cytidylate kinase
MSAKVIIVAIDGPSGVGKSTVAATVARRLGLPFLETGAMYRALGWQIYRKGLDPADQRRVEEEAQTLPLELEALADGSVAVLLDGRALDDRVRSPEVSEITSQTSSYRGVRRRMVALQRDFAENHGAVMEGRDIGTKVFPDTPHKFFMNAPLEVRVERRLRQLEGAGKTGLTAVQLQREVAERDQRDRQREESPLRFDDSYTVIETAEQSADEAATLIVERVLSASQTRAGDC